MSHAACWVFKFHQHWSWRDLGHVILLGVTKKVYLKQGFSWSCVAQIVSAATMGFLALWSLFKSLWLLFYFRGIVAMVTKVEQYVISRVWEEKGSHEQGWNWSLSFSHCYIFNNGFLLFDLVLGSGHCSHGNQSRTMCYFLGCNRRKVVVSWDGTDHCHTAIVTSSTMGSFLFDLVLGSGLCSHDNQSRTMCYFWGVTGERLS